MDIKLHNNSNDTLEKVELFPCEDLNMRMSMNVSEGSDGPFFSEIEVLEYDARVSDKFELQFYFGKGPSVISRGFYADGLLKEKNEDLQRQEETFGKLRRLFYDEETKTNMTGCILNVKFQKGKAKQVDLFDLVDGVLVPVATVASNGSVTKMADYQKNVSIEEERSPNARPFPKIKIDERSL